MLDFIHYDPEFNELLSIVSSKKGVDITLVEKDYWIMHALYSLQQQGIEFELKGGTSLSKGYGLIHRFSFRHIGTNRQSRQSKNSFGQLRPKTARVFELCFEPVYKTRR